MNETKNVARKSCLILTFLFGFSSVVPAFAVNPEPVLMTALFDPGVGKLLYLAYVSEEGTPELRMMTFNGSSWRPGPNLPEPQTAPYSPTMTVFQDKLWVATTMNATVNPEPVMCRAYNGSTWEESMLAPDYTIGALNPAIAAYQHMGPLRPFYWLFLFWQTPTNDVYGTVYEATDGWLAQPFPVANETLDETEPTAAVYGDLYVAWVSNDTIRCQAFNGWSWIPAVNPEPVLCPTGPSLAVHEDLLYLAYEAEDAICVQAFNGSTWTMNPDLIDPQPTPYDPTICSYFGSSLLYLAYVSGDEIHCQTYDGVDWSSPAIVIPEYRNILVLLIVVTATTAAALITKRITKKPPHRYI
jgi:hypothetical protein